MIHNILTIAGSDPSGGAGIQADLKTFGALGTYGCAVLTALTAQNTRQVTGVHPVPPEFVALQIDTLFADVRIDAVKVGMVATAEIAGAVAGCLRNHQAKRVVLDPVMVAKSGDRLLAEAAVAAVREELAPLADLLMPNLPEAADLTGRPEPTDLAEMRALLPDLLALGPKAVVLKGGHLGTDDAPDLFADGQRVVELPGRRIATKNTHGTGCSYSSAIAALLPRHDDPLEAVRAAKAWLSGAIARADQLEVGQGHGPIHHYHALWSER
ncbi:MAG TPA: bifunctional hydroxymethylpyrimidine kinase/phosphomethylpyrimidine kinase [Geminicoccus sp.]|uniref:bifunctional hydroxymethylpyrimidine kinase/phosphomethylpyrimidine kinase n=1 Tax=Geminicoccus sp. TaxID=2024832 RepID=UPI002BF2945E|nr:bifunctional hydroxymethylpyrimidine kinase/phosphomethylpyrimidine kinase [Geminicoccus sp.]HWL71578.1 bifunctional hydroxymethylpyrimidine kinase/phosphomethylpyrimidine kinase [Geminicoccus sp.]